jgi:hypothetical protein
VDLAARARQLLDELHGPRDTRQFFRRLKRQARAELRRHKAFWFRQIEQFGLWGKGFEIRGWSRADLPALARAAAGEPVGAAGPAAPGPVRRPGPPEKSLGVPSYGTEYSVLSTEFRGSTPVDRQSPTRGRTLAPILQCDGKMGSRERASDYADRVLHPYMSFT